MKTTMKIGLTAILLATQLNAVETKMVTLPEHTEITRTTVVAPQQAMPSVLSLTKSGFIGVNMLFASIIAGVIIMMFHEGEWDGLPIVENYPKITTGICSIGVVSLFATGLLNFVNMVKKIQLRRQLNKAHVTQA